MNFSKYHTRETIWGKNPLTHGKTSTPETVSKWIAAGLELAEKEAARRADGSVAGRQIPNEQRYSKRYRRNGS